jgi:hypothetical protein
MAGGGWFTDRTTTPGAETRNPCDYWPITRKARCALQRALATGERFSPVEW